MSLKNKLATYTALAGILAGSVGFGGFGCEKRSLEGKLNQPGVQASQKVGSFKENLYKRLESNYKNFNKRVETIEKNGRILEFDEKTLKIAYEILPFFEKEDIRKTKAFLNFKDYEEDIFNYLTIEYYSKHPDKFIEEMEPESFGYSIQEYLQKFKYPLNLEKYCKKNPKDEEAGKLLEISKRYLKDGLDVKNLSKEEFLMLKMNQILSDPLF